MEETNGMKELIAKFHSGETSNAPSTLLELHAEISMSPDASGGWTEFYTLRDILLSNSSGKNIGPQSSISKMTANTESVVMIVKQEHILQASHPDFVRINSTFLSKRRVDNKLRICPGTLFADQLSASASGTGFFIKEDMILTAAHVILNAGNGINIGNYRFVRAVIKKTPTAFQTTIEIPKSQVFMPDGDELLHSHYRMSSMGADWAAIKVKPAYPGNKLPAIQFPVVQQTPVLNGTPVYCVGHGLALTMKISYKGKVIISDISRPYFECELTLLGGNSGSPVFHAETHELLGIYVRGTKKLIKKGRCLTVKTNDQNPIEGQECQRLDPIIVELGL